MKMWLLILLAIGAIMSLAACNIVEVATPYIWGTEMKEGRIDNPTQYNTDIKFVPYRDNRTGTISQGGGDIQVGVNAENYRHLNLQGGMTYKVYVYNPITGGWQYAGEFTIPDTDKPTARPKNSPEAGPFFWVFELTY